MIDFGLVWAERQFRPRHQRRGQVVGSGVRRLTAVVPTPSSTPASPGTRRSGMADLGTLLPGPTDTPCHGHQRRPAGRRGTRGYHAFRYTEHARQRRRMVPILGRRSRHDRPEPQAWPISDVGASMTSASWSATRWMPRRDHAARLPVHPIRRAAAAGSFADLGTLGGTYSVGRAINTSGQVVGHSKTTGGAQHAFLYTGTPGVDGHMIDLDAWLDANNPTEGAKWTLTSAAGVTDTGLITGEWQLQRRPRRFDRRHPRLPARRQRLVSTSLPGDYNHDGKVDAADYVVWRKSNGSQSGYNTWRSHFGQSAGSGAALPSVRAAVGRRARAGDDSSFRRRIGCDVRFTFPTFKFAANWTTNQSSASGPPAPR